MAAAKKGGLGKGIDSLIPNKVSATKTEAKNENVKKELKKNPPINEQMIKTMMSQMGRTPSQKQVNQMMKQMNKFM